MQYCVATGVDAVEKEEERRKKGWMGKRGDEERGYEEKKKKGERKESQQPTSPQPFLSFKSFNHNAFYYPMLPMALSLLKLVCYPFNLEHF